MSDDLLSDFPDWPGTRPPKNRTEGAKRGPKPSSGMPEDVRPKTFRIKGEDVELFSIGDLACLLQKKPVTIRMWESKGWIPKANWRSAAPKGEQIPGKPVKGRRLYTRPQVELLSQAVQQFRLDDKSKADWTGFRQHIREHWPV